MVFHLPLRWLTRALVYTGLADLFRRSSLCRDSVFTHRISEQLVVTVSSPSRVIATSRQDILDGNRNTRVPCRIVEACS